MVELAFIAYIISLISLAISLFLWVEVRELKQQRKRDLVQKRLKQIMTPVKQRPKGYWD